MQFIGSASKKGILAGNLEKEIDNIPDAEGVYYRNFPIISTFDGSIQLDALCCADDYGVLIFHIYEEQEYNVAFFETVENAHLRVISLLSEVKSLNRKRQLIVPVTSFVYAPRLINGEIDFEEDDMFIIRHTSELPQLLVASDWDAAINMKAVLSRMQSLTGLKSKTQKRDYLKSPDSKGAALRKLESDLATLDINQTRAVLENVDSVQRIRGLAGSGKTIVLARKIAHLHAQHSDWNIAVTFNTRSLKEQFTRLISLFYKDARQTNEEPNWKKVNILHAWGSPNSEGIYYKACLDNNVKYYDFSMAKYIRAPGETEFQSVCKNWLDNKPINIKKMYDLILIDEAQDFTPEFLKLCYELLGDKKRLVYAYDELQNLSDSSMPSPDEIWGLDSSGQPVVSFNNKACDIILDVCYRNPGPILSAAHALGFGIYRDEMIQMFDFSELWSEIGYEVKAGELAEGKYVELARSSRSSPTLLTSHNTVDDLIQFKYFNNLNEESDWIASEILKNLHEDELLPSDIIVIFPDAIKLRSSVGYLRDKLYSLGVKSNIAGVTSSPDEFFSDDSITFTSIYRAKGNEAAVVYILGAGWCNAVYELSKRRNVLFTAMTRTKAWLRVCGSGSNFMKLLAEFEMVKSNDFKLCFTYPTSEQRETMRVVNRDMTASERRRVNQARSKAEDLTMLLSSEVNPEDIPLDVRNRLIAMLKGQGAL
ncbi:DEAD/DEAH box helicase [Aeromonas sp. 600282]|uniref:DEAD/DEAH box helicase n=1 Tax=Aeromonas sp. 600282 TaxID=2712027 RepID=UPI003B9E70A7